MAKNTEKDDAKMQGSREIEGKQESREAGENPAGPETEAKQEAWGAPVACSFCGNDTFCDPCKMNPVLWKGVEHICYDCYLGLGGNIPEKVKENIHVCIPPEQFQVNFERFMNENTQRAFFGLWNNQKKRLKEMSKQELAQATFFEGARFMFAFMQQMNMETNKGKGPQGEDKEEAKTEESGAKEEAKTE